MVWHIISFNTSFAYCKSARHLLHFITGSRFHFSKEEWKCLNIKFNYFPTKNFNNDEELLSVFAVYSRHGFTVWLYLYISQDKMLSKCCYCSVSFCYSAFWLFHLYTVYISGLFVNRSHGICSLWVWYGRSHYVNSMI